MSNQGSVAPTAQTETQETKGEKPLFSERLGPGLELSGWEHTDEQGRLRYSLRLNKRWRDKAGNWIGSHIDLFENELPYVSLLAERGFIKCAQSRQGRNGGASESAE